MKIEINVTVSEFEKIASLCHPFFSNSYVIYKRNIIYSKFHLSFRFSHFDTTHFNDNLLTLSYELKKKNSIYFKTVLHILPKISLILCVLILHIFVKLLNYNLYYTKSVRYNLGCLQKMNAVGGTFNIKYNFIKPSLIQIFIFCKICHNIYHNDFFFKSQWMHCNLLPYPAPFLQAPLITIS